MTTSAAAQRLLQACFWIPLSISTWLALTPAPPEFFIFSLSDVLQHTFALSYLSFALMVAYARLNALQTLLLMLLYGAAIELIQSQIVERSAELKDLGSDLIGIGLGVLLAKVAAAPLRALVLRLFSKMLRK